MARKKKETLPEIVPEIFEHDQFGQFRYIKRDEEIWFVGKDVCRVLGYTNPQKALRDHVPDKYKRGILVSEPGLYRLIMRSNLPAAEKFMDWVCEEVLPSIRKYGYYSVAAKKKTVIYLGNPAPELLEPMTEEEFFAVIDKLLTDQVEFLKIKK